MLLGAVADDFTGASDLANTLARGGMVTTLLVGAAGMPPPCEAGVVALKTRSLPAAEAVAQSLAAARWLLDQGCTQIIFKYCSTFDSTPAGNIGPVTEALLDFLGADLAILCPAFPAAGRRVFMGHLFVGDKLLNESGMQNHPLTPMTDPDLRRVLALQTQGSVGSVGLDALRADLPAALAAQRAAGHRLIVTDAVTDDDLHLIGRAAANHRLITGGSGIALGLPQNFRDQGLLSNQPAALSRVEGQGVVLCGSCSAASQLQVATYLKDHPGLSIAPIDLMAGKYTAPSAAQWVRAQTITPIVYSTADSQHVKAAQTNYGREKVAETIERFFGDLAKILADEGYNRFVVGGGETSGAVVESLGLGSLYIGAEIDPGVPALLAARGGALGLALKSGNFGATDFFVKALQKVRHD